MRDKSYQHTVVGGEVAKYLRVLRWSERSQNTLDTYELVLARLAADHAHYGSLEEFTTEGIREFLDEHWSNATAATKAARLAAVKSFFKWAVNERGLARNPASPIDRPKVRNGERHAYRPDLVHRLITAQPSLRDQIGCQLLGRLGFRKDELRRNRLLDFDLAERVEDAARPDAEQVQGTPEYMSPEQAKGEPLGFQSDIYSLAVVIFELFTGEVPFRGDTAAATARKQVEEKAPLSGPRAARLPPPLA